MDRLRHKVSRIFRRGGLNSESRHDSQQEKDAVEENPLGNAYDLGIRVHDIGSMNKLESNSHVESSADGLGKAGLTFRTVTTLLALIRRNSELKYSELSSNKKQYDVDSDDLYDLGISDAFATLIAADGHSVAVTTKRSSDRLDIIACVTRLSAKDEQLISPAARTKMERPQSTLLSPSSQPSSAVVDAINLAGLNHNDDNCQSKGLRIRCHLNPGPLPPLAAHVRILSKLLTMQEIPVEKFHCDPCAELRKRPVRERLRLYVTATCHTKMLRRLEDEALSMPYIKSLKSITDIPSNFQQKSPSNGNNNDRHFLVNVILYFLNLKLIRTEIPNLTREARLAEQNAPFHPYTSDTWMEVHHLLLEFLDKFHQALLGLRASDGVGSSTSDVPQINSTDRRVGRVWVSAYVLQTLLEGSVLAAHLETISPLLGEYLRNNRPPSIYDSAPDSDKQFSESDGWTHSKDRDDDLEAVQPSAIEDGSWSERPLWKTYIEWLKLMVVHFDALETLDRYVTGPLFPYKNFSIHILIPRPVHDGAVLPWRELFADEGVFSGYRPDFNKKLTEFLEKVAGSNARDSLRWIQDAKQSWLNGDIENAFQNVRRLKKSTLPGWSECAGKLLSKLETTPQPKPYPESFILGMMESLCEDGAFFLWFQDASEPDFEFRGTLHSEALLNSLVECCWDSRFCNKNVQASMRDFERIIGVSHRCCLACAQLLSVFRRRDQDLPPQLVRGSHNKTTPCTLPPWLSASTVTSINQNLAHELRGSLASVMTRSERVWDRVKSISSRGYDII